MNYEVEVTEKENFFRLCHLLIDGGTSVLREVFDDKIPPAALDQVLGANTMRKSINDLKKSRILSKAQFQVIYPGSKKFGKSRDFDISILSALLRNICNVPAPSTGWDAKPNPADDDFGADLVRLRLYRNELYAHVKSTSLDNDTYRRYSEDIIKVLVRIGGADWEAKCDRLLTEPLTEEAKASLEELTSWYKLDTELKEEFAEIKHEMKCHSQEVTHVFDALSDTDRQIYHMSQTIDQLKARSGGQGALWTAFSGYCKMYLLLALLGGVLLMILRLLLHSEDHQNLFCLKQDQNQNAIKLNQVQQQFCSEQVMPNFVPLFAAQIVIYLTVVLAWPLVKHQTLNLLLSLPSEHDAGYVYSTVRAAPVKHWLNGLQGTYMLSLLARVWMPLMFLSSQVYLHGYYVEPWMPCIISDNTYTCRVNEASYRNFILQSNIFINSIILLSVLFEVMHLLQHLTLRSAGMKGYRKIKWLNDYDFLVLWFSCARLERQVRMLLAGRGYDLDSMEPYTNMKSCDVPEGKEDKSLVENNILRNKFKVRTFGNIGDDPETFRNPRGLGFCFQDNHLYVADSTNHRIQVLDQDGRFVRFVGKGQGSEPGQLTSPRDLTIDRHGNIVIADTENHRVQVLRKDGGVIRIIKEKGSAGHFNRPCGVTVSNNGNIIVADTYNHVIAIFEEIGSLVKQFGGYGKHVGRFDHPYTTEVDQSDNIYVPDFYNDRVQVFSPTGEFIRVFAPNAYFTKPSVVCFVDADTLLVTQWTNDSLRLFSKEGKQLGRLGARGAGYQQFNSPCGVVKGQDKIYITDTGNHRVYILYMPSLVK